MGIAASHHAGAGRLDLGPRQAETGTPGTTCVVDGTITNLGALARLGDTGTDADAETVVARAYEARGDEILGEILGSWSIALWDRRRRVGLIAKDPLGGRPVHFHDGGGVVEVASEVVDVVDRLGERPGLDRTAMAHWLARRPLPTASTLLDGLGRLPAGHLLRLGRGRARVERWWSPCYEPPRPRDRDEAAAALAEGMAAAVGRAAGTADPPGVLLSGGFDSLSVAALMPTAAPARSYSVVFPGFPEVDESRRIARAAEVHGLDPTILEFDDASPIDAAAQFVSAWGVPPVTPNHFVWRPLFERAAGDGVAAVVDGEGGDELFGCSPALIADLLRGGRPLAAIDAARSLPGYTAGRYGRWTRRSLRIYGIRDGLPAGIHRLARRVGIGTPREPPSWLNAEARGLLDDDADLAWKHLDGPRWWAGLVRAVVDRPDGIGAADELRRAAAGHGLERRHPWRDRELIELVLGLAPDLAFDPVLDRRLAREAMRGRLDDRLRLSRSKPVFNRVLADAFGGRERGRLRDALVRDLPEPLASFVERDALAHSLPESRAGTGGWSPALWPLLSASIWLSQADSRTAA